MLFLTFPHGGGAGKRAPGRPERRGDVFLRKRAALTKAPRDGIIRTIKAGMAEQADATDLKSVEETHAGSTPATCTTQKAPPKRCLLSCPPVRRGADAGPRGFPLSHTKGRAPAGARPLLCFFYAAAQRPASASRTASAVLSAARRSPLSLRWTRSSVMFPYRSGRRRG